jgi:polysaccharide biosynthesis protein PslG
MLRLVAAVGLLVATPLLDGTGGTEPQPATDPAAQTAQQRTLRGVQLHPLWSDTSVRAFDRELDLARKSGANAVRIDISWSSLELRRKRRFDRDYVKRADTFLSHARRRGLKVVANLWSTPCWASVAPAEVKRGCRGRWWRRGLYRYAPRRARDYADAAAWVARRWGHVLAALEVWNEPNLTRNHLHGVDDPAATYAGILRAAYPRVKAVAPRLPVLGGVLAFSDGEFLERLYQHGIAGHHDGISIHPYNEWRDPDDPWKPEWRKYSFREGVPWIHYIMDAHGEGGKGIWLTEFGFSTCREGDRWCVSEREQAEYIGDSFRIAAEWPYVRAAIAYNLRNKGWDPDDREDQFGLVRRSFERKPGYGAFREAMRARR